ncbi:hypothetical protein DPMN_054285 [Dreissena polymorpha]|uniref:Uncharacterized protein n=1 Tax=Dreissena polymorpha TaxID=45954 RepID=A0A9D4CQE5_DREPO|nr:hypothetical protein DPMN_054285 [Dreissena polymorpha]
MQFCVSEGCTKSAAGYGMVLRASGNNGVLFEMMNSRLSNKYTFEAQNSEAGDHHANVGLDKLTRSLVLALGVCYHACLGSTEAPKIQEKWSPNVLEIHVY